MYRNTRPTEWLALCRALESEADGFGPLEGASDRIPDARRNCVLGISPAAPQHPAAAGSPAPRSAPWAGAGSDLRATLIDIRHGLAISAMVQARSARGRDIRAIYVRQYVTQMREYRRLKARSIELAAKKRALLSGVRPCV